MRSFVLQLRIKTPVHVGMGNDHNHPAFAYLPEPNQEKVVLLDPTRLVVELDEERRQAFLAAVADGPVRAQRLLQGWYREGIPLPEVGRLPASPAFIKAVEKASGAAELDFRPLPRSIEGPYLPGSSVKGALRTAWIYALLEPKLRDQDLVFKAHEDWRAEPKRGRDGVIRPGRGGLRAAQQLEAYALGYHRDRKLDMYKDPFRAVRLGDSAPLPVTRLEHVGVVHPSNRLDDVTILAEVVPEGTALRMPFRYHEALATEGVVAGSVDPEDLAGAAYAFYLNVLEEDRAYAEENDWADAAKFYQAFAREIEGSEDAFPLRLGFGSGKLANTLLFLMTEPFPKTRKAVGSTEPRFGLPLGWALARLIETEL